MRQQRGTGIDVLVGERLLSRLRLDEGIEAVVRGAIPKKYIPLN